MSARRRRRITLTVAAGDYNRDGVVDAGDYVVWRKMSKHERRVTAYAGADGNGDTFRSTTWTRRSGGTISATTRAAAVAAGVGHRPCRSLRAAASSACGLRFHCRLARQSAGGATCAVKNGLAPLLAATLRRVCYAADRLARLRRHVSSATGFGGCGIGPVCVNILLATAASTPLYLPGPQPNIEMPSIIKERLASGKIVRTMHVVGLCDAEGRSSWSATLGNIHGVWIDQEHSAIPHAQLELMMMACRAAGDDVFARVPPTDYATVMRPMKPAAAA